MFFPRGLSKRKSPKDSSRSFGCLRDHPRRRHQDIAPEARRRRVAAWRPAFGGKELSDFMVGRRLSFGFGSHGSDPILVGR